MQPQSSSYVFRSSFRRFQLCFYIIVLVFQFYFNYSHFNSCLNLIFTILLNLVYFPHFTLCHLLYALAFQLFNLCNLHYALVFQLLYFTHFNLRTRLYILYFTHSLLNYLFCALYFLHLSFQLHLNSSTFTLCTCSSFHHVSPKIFISTHSTSFGCSHKALTPRQ